MVGEATVYDTRTVYETVGAYKAHTVYKEKGSAPVNIVHIGDYDYNYVQIGDLLWTTENFKQNTSLSVWYNNTPNDKGKLYTWNDFTEINNLLSDGWRIPTRSDGANLITGRTASSLLATSEGGTNETGFSFILAGYRFADNSFYDVGSEGDFLLSQQGYRIRATSYDSSFSTPNYDYNDNYRFSMRFCKNA